MAKGYGGRRRRPPQASEQRERVRRLKRSGTRSSPVFAAGKNGPRKKNHSNNSTGVSCLPDVDDQVLVISLDIHKTKLVALGAVWSEVAAPPETGENSDADLNQDGKNSLSFIKTKAENMIILDDTDGKEKLQIIQNKTNSRIEFIAEDKKLSITTDEEIDLAATKDLCLNAENMTFEAEKEFNVSCENYQVKASKEIKIEADKDMTLKGSGIALN